MEKEEKKEYPKYRNYSFYILIVILLIAWFVGRNVFNDAARLFNTKVWVFALISIIITFIINSIFYEIGKVIFGAIAGYRRVYTNIFGFCWYKNEKNKTKFRISGWEGYGCATIMSPKFEDNKKWRPTLYLLGGTIFVVIIDVIILVAGILLHEYTYEGIYRSIGYVQGTIGLILVLLNLAPFLSDGVMDGFNLRLVHFSNENLKLFHDNLKQLDSLYSGRNELKEIKYDDYHNFMAISSLIYQCYYYLDLDKYKDAENCINIIFEHKDYALEEDIIKAYSLKYFFMILRKEEQKVEEEYWELPKNIRKGANNYSNFENFKTALLMAAFVETNYDLYEYITTKIEGKKKSYPFLLRKEKEDTLIEKSLKFIEQRKPDWFGKEVPEESSEDNENN